MSQKYELKRIPPEEIDFADNNPRGEKPAEIEADPTFEQLKESVWKYGVLVPIVVHRQKSGKTFRLIDGERRLRAALSTKVALIPAHIATNESDLDDLVKAFHIHMLRKQWKPVAQAKALKRIIDALEAKGELANVDDALEELRMQTACSPTRLKSLRRAIKFPEAVLKVVDDGKLNFSYLVQIEESFVEALQHPRIAWDGPYENWAKVRDCVDMLKEVGYGRKDIFIFMVFDHYLSYEEMKAKLDACRRWKVRVIDCRYRPLDQTFDNYIPGSKPQTSADYYIHPNWTDGQVRRFRQCVRRQNIAILLDLPNGRYLSGCETRKI